jgi:hypothetical protein
VAAVASLVRNAAPAAKESIKWAQPVWELNGPVCSIKAFPNGTNINFWRGAELAERADPNGRSRAQAVSCGTSGSSVSRISAPRRWSSWCELPSS